MRGVPDGPLLDGIFCCFPFCPVMLVFGTVHNKRENKIKRYKSLHFEIRLSKWQLQEMWWHHDNHSLTWSWKSIAGNCQKNTRFLLQKELKENQLAWFDRTIIPGEPHELSPADDTEKGNTKSRAQTKHGLRIALCCTRMIKLSIRTWGL